jgi:hypothetical protein
VTLPDDVPIERERTNVELARYVLVVFLPLFAGFTAFLLWIRGPHMSWTEAVGVAALLAAITGTCYSLLVWTFDRQAAAAAAKSRVASSQPGDD